MLPIGKAYQADLDDQLPLSKLAKKAKAGQSMDSPQVRASQKDKRDLEAKTKLAMARSKGIAPEALLKEIDGMKIVDHVRALKEEGKSLRQDYVLQLWEKYAPTVQKDDVSHLTVRQELKDRVVLATHTCHNKMDRSYLINQLNKITIALNKRELRGLLDKLLKGVQVNLTEPLRAVTLAILDCIARFKLHVTLPKETEPYRPVFDLAVTADWAHCSHSLKQDPAGYFKENREILAFFYDPQLAEDVFSCDKYSEVGKQVTRLCGSSDIGEAMFKSFVPKVNDSVIADCLSEAWELPLEGQQLSNRDLFVQEAAALERLEALGLSKHSFKGRKVQLSYRSDPVKIPLKSVPEVSARSRSAFVKSNSVGRGLKPFDWEEMIAPVQEGPQLFTDEVLAPLVKARRQIMADIKPEHYNDAAELHQLLVSKAGVYHRLDPNLDIEMTWLLAVNEGRGLARTKELVLDELANEDYHPALLEAYRAIDNLREHPLVKLIGEEALTVVESTCGILEKLTRQMGPSNEAVYKGTPFLELVYERLLWFVEFEKRHFDAFSEETVYGPPAIVMITKWLEKRMSPKVDAGTDLTLPTRLEPWRMLLPDPVQKMLAAVKKQIEENIKAVASCGQGVELVSAQTSGRQKRSRKSAAAGDSCGKKANATSASAKEKHNDGW